MKLSFTVPSQGKVSARWEKPVRPLAAMVLAHGAGAGMTHSGMERLAEALQRERIATFRFQFPYMEKGSKRPDSPAVAITAVAAAVAAARKKAGRLPLFVGGKSFGGRMTTHAAAQGRLAGVTGIICFSFPLHPPKKPGTERAAHLEALAIPTLWIQGTRDELADVALVKQVTRKYRQIIHTHFVAGADHSYHVLKSSGRTDAQVLEEVARTAREFIQSQLA